MPVLALLVAMLTSRSLGTAIARLHARIAPLRQALDAADRELGDGDTGMTVEQIVAAWNAVAPQFTTDVGVSLGQLARETRRCTGSSLGSVVAMGLAAAGKTAQGREGLDAGAVAGALAAATAAIAARSGASPGDKTILDSLVRVADVLRDDAASERPLDASVDASAAALADFRARECRVGRARVYGARSAGRDDPGMLAAHLLLKALQDP